MSAANAGSETNARRARKAGTKPKFDIHRHVTDRIVAAIEAGTPPWRKPWTGEAGGAVFPLRSTGEPYRGVNGAL